MRDSTRELLKKRLSKFDFSEVKQHGKKEIIIETDRLYLRRYCKEDLDWRISTDEMIAVKLKSNHKMIGNVYLGKRNFESLEIGYVFNKQYWGQGYATESCTALIKKAFSQGIHRIFAECDPCNLDSWKLLERLGFERKAHYKQNVYFWKDDSNNPIWKDAFVYTI